MKISFYYEKIKSRHAQYGNVTIVDYSIIISNVMENIKITPVSEIFIPFHKK